MSVRNLESLFCPRSIAVIGVSDHARNLGSIVLDNLLQGGFAGPIWAVDRQDGERNGLKIHRDVRALPEAPELAVICTPPAAVPPLIAELGRGGTRGAIVMTAGLRQRPSEDEPTYEQAMLDAARPWRLRILGPNCIGALAPHVGLNASFAPGRALPGSIAFVTQSGALAAAMLDWANANAIGFSHFVSLGDSADVDFGDMLDYLGSDGATRAILMYVESVKHARKFMSAARAAARNKPVILVKAGRAPAGAKAAASHTGAMAGSDTVFDAAVRRAGMLRVDSLEALFDAAQTLSRPRSWFGGRLAVLTNGGGAGVLAADALALGGGELAQLSPATLAALDEFLPATWPHANPVDIIGDAPVQRYRSSFETLLAAPEVDGVLFMHAPTAIVAATDIAKACAPTIRQAAKPVLVNWLGGVSVREARELFAREGIACYGTPERAVAAWLQLARYHANQEALLELPDAQAAEYRPDRAAAQEIVDQALAEGREWLEPTEATELLRAYGIPAVETMNAADAEEAARFAQRIGFPVALKIRSPQVVHKSDVGGVALHLNSADEVREAAIRMRQSVSRLAPHARVRGFLVQAMARRPDALELIVGIASDPVFGPAVLFGEGGTAVELRRDRAVALPPLNAKLAQDLVGQTQVGRLLAGYRGRAACDMRAVTGAIESVSRLACDLDSIAELDINPLLADAGGVLALDARVRLRRPAEGEGSRLALRPYPSELERRIEVDGHKLLLRPIRPEDGARLAAFYSAASPADLRLRFFMARREVPKSELARYCLIDYEREMTFVALEDGEIVGEVRGVCDADNVEAEFAVHVAGKWQHHGLGQRLTDCMLDYLRARGTRRVVAYCLRENAGMVAVGRHAGFGVSEGPDGTCTLRLELRPDEAAVRKNPDATLAD
ncbi:MAG TPA: bifunctional acetate--CoA ligase family protein/GNAT family N-acetyltransferase [Ramlibacter sp.]|uniref:bifunctional acetate--CoA ligase family protein/GNAT family N-acetyltransferase n=1 Tax=Ramlibacter sp. TaxID=1917967 RepID=UPI002C4F64E3|nr:bifunctional acetate--CoA ligase family protein/GNAT family N-acetyltransferase [Ramlibacter sp.]HVZ42827.1 bifunctional acetate--CoA ligase family protein/GNAT family N-acetyltransferase [Ramlibacter sp.]